jgi:hypothetical protein
VNRAIVVGSGVSGLSCASELLDAGFSVEVWSAEPVLQTTSAVAAAFWFPYRVGPIDRVSGWATISHARFESMAANSECGVRMRELIEVFRDPRLALEPSPWLHALDVRPATPAELPAGFAAGRIAWIPVIDTSIYLPWLEAKLRDRGAWFRIRHLDHFAPALEQANIVVNASGLGARALANDPGVYAIAGQVLRVSAGATERVFVDESDPERPTYVAHVGPRFDSKRSRLPRVEPSSITTATGARESLCPGAVPPKSLTSLKPTSSSWGKTRLKLEDKFLQNCEKGGVRFGANKQTCELAGIVQMEIPWIAGTEHADVTGNIGAENGNAANHSLRTCVGAAFHHRRKHEQT